MLYSIVPEDQVMAETQHEPAYQDAVINGCTMQIQPLGLGWGQLVRIISSDPQHYLHPAYQPGSMISLNHE